jgi:hypothetical protein
MCTFIAHSLMNGVEAVTRARIRAPLRRQGYPPFDGKTITLEVESTDSLTSSLMMVIPLLITTSRRSPPFIWRSTYVVGCRSSSRPSLARRPVLSQLVAPPTSFPLEEPITTLHEKSPPRTRSLHLARQVRL